MDQSNCRDRVTTQTLTEWKCGYYGSHLWSHFLYCNVCRALDVSYDWVVHARSVVVVHERHDRRRTQPVKIKIVKSNRPSHTNVPYVCKCAGKSWGLDIKRVIKSCAFLSWMGRNDGAALKCNAWWKNRRWRRQRSPYGKNIDENSVPKLLPGSPKGIYDGERGALQFIHGNETCRATRVVLGPFIEEVLGDLLRVNNDDVLGQQSGVDDAAWTYTMYISQDLDVRHGGTNHILFPISHTSSRGGEYQSRECCLVPELAEVRGADDDVYCSSCADETLAT